jgi:hypothetical protein
MGYMSKVAFMAVFANAEQHDEVMAVYRMKPEVQEHKIEATWRRVDRSDGVVVRVYEASNVKWYDSYSDVQAVEYLGELLEMFFEERGFEYAWGNVRIGENTDDTVETVHAPQGSLDEVIYATMRLVRSIEIDI